MKFPHKHRTSAPSICRLCGATGKLIRSHIFPNFFIRALQGVKVGSDGSENPTVTALSTRKDVTGGTKAGGYWEKVFGLIELLLCSSCELRFSRYEAYFRNTFYEKATSKRLAKKDVGTLKFGPFEEGSVHGLIAVRDVRVDYRLLKLFALSLLWRCSVASGDFFSQVTLGDKHETRLQTALLSEDPGDELLYPVGMIDIRETGSDLIDYFENPIVNRDPDKFRVCRIVIGGFAFLIYIASENHAPPSDVLTCSLRNDGGLTLIVARGTQMLEYWAHRLRSADAIPPA